MLARCDVSAALDQSAFVPVRIAYIGEVRSAESGEFSGGVRKLDGVAAVRALSFAPSGLASFPVFPTACAVGCTLAPLRG